MKQIEIKTSKKSKWIPEEENEKLQESQMKLARKQLTGAKILDEDIYEPVRLPLTTLHIIEKVINRPEEKGPHGEIKSFPNKDQRVFFKIMSKIESLPSGATHIELQNSEVEFIVKKTKAYKDRWWTQDRIFNDFEIAFGIIDEEEDVDPSLNGHAKELETV